MIDIAQERETKHISEERMQTSMDDRNTTALAQADASPDRVNGVAIGCWIENTDQYGRPSVVRSRGGLPGMIRQVTPHPGLVAREEAALLNQDDAGRTRTIRDALAEAKGAYTDTDVAGGQYWLLERATFETDAGRAGAQVEALARFDGVRRRGIETYARAMMVARAADNLVRQAHASEPALTDAELATATTREPHVRASVERLDATSLATMIRSAVIRADWPLIALLDRHAPARVEALRTPTPLADGRVAIGVAPDALAEVDSGLRRVHDMLATRPRPASRPLPWERDIAALNRQLEELARAANDHPSRREPGKTVDGTQKVPWPV